MTEIPIESLFQSQKLQAQALRMQSWKSRLPYLKSLKAALLKYENEIIQAHVADFKKPADETLLTEIFPVLEEINLFQRNLHRWSRPQEVGNPPLLLGSDSRVYFEAKGAVLIISSWNYPFALSLTPLVGAIGAGNTVCLKPSELTPHVSRLLKKIVQEIFPPEMVSVVEGGAEVSQKLLSFPWDHIFFTGSTNVGRIVMQAAAKNLSPVTLELGGKSPAIVDASAHLKNSAEQMIWGKTVNNGQTCVSPDFVYVHAKVWDEFIQECKLAVERLQKNHQRPQIISDKHYQRLMDLKTQSTAQGARVLLEGVTDGQRDLSPVLMEITTREFGTELMNQEIFGPLLPMIKYEHDDEVVQHVNSQGKPLSLYLFSQNETQIQFWLRAISSGGVTINNTLLHVGNHHLPFGGIGASGIGKYHGHFSFLEFSHQRAVLHYRWTHAILRKFYPPYSLESRKLMSFLVRWMIKLPW